nr:ribosome small subunit-dependent GTPase A [Rubellimicrobium sp. CFH 75288]
MAALGWSPVFADQRSAAETGLEPARVAEIHRDRLVVLPGPRPLAAPAGTGAFAVGDWLLHDGTRALRRLAPRTEIVRRAAGAEAARQVVAANVDTLALVSSCNAEFNPARIERMLALALQAGCAPVLVLTRADQADPAPFLDRLAALAPGCPALALDARDPDQVRPLCRFAGPGQTLALLGSSGVGKTTLRNALTGEAAATAAIRAADARGRHTTTVRTLRPALAGGWVIDMPGMREFGLLDAAEGLRLLFADVEALARSCRFRDCAHGSEPGCAVRPAVEEGRLDPVRLERWRKLAEEERSSTRAARSRAARSGRRPRPLPSDPEEEEEEG